MLRVRSTFVAALVVGLNGVSTCFAGPITPPPGPAASTHKTLGEVEPRIAINAVNTPGDANSLHVIRAPGSYYLTGDIVGVSGKNGIAITADNVTIDLMGFTLRGSEKSLRGIVQLGEQRYITVKNGNVTGWTSYGVYLWSGFDTDRGKMVERIHASSNGNAGIGIDAGIIASVVNCSAVSNTGDGIQASGNSTVTHCSSQQNGGNGFTLDSATLLTDCVARSNSGNGIDARGGSTVRGCSSDRNSLDGIVAATRSLIVGNTLALNGQSATTPGAGIRLTGSDNVVEGNNSVQNDIGIQAESAGNIIRGNTCSGNTTVSYLFVADNFYGPIIDRRIVATPAVNGHVAASTLGSTDPHANFAY